MFAFGEMHCCESEAETFRRKNECGFLYFLNALFTIKTDKRYVSQSHGLVPWKAKRLATAK